MKNLFPQILCVNFESAAVKHIYFKGRFINIWRITEQNNNLLRCLTWRLQECSISAEMRCVPALSLRWRTMAHHGARLPALYTGLFLCRNVSLPAQKLFFRYFPLSKCDPDCSTLRKQKQRGKMKIFLLMVPLLERGTIFTHFQVYFSF